MMKKVAQWISGYLVSVYMIFVQDLEQVSL